MLLSALFGSYFKPQCQTLKWLRTLKIQNILSEFKKYVVFTSYLISCLRSAGLYGTYLYFAIRIFSNIHCFKKLTDILTHTIQVASSKILAYMSKKALYVKIKEMCLCSKTSHKSPLLSSRSALILGFLLLAINCASNHLQPIQMQGDQKEMYLVFFSFQPDMSFYGRHKRVTTRSHLKAIRGDRHHEQVTVFSDESFLSSLFLKLSIMNCTPIFLFLLKRRRI